MRSGKSSESSIDDGKILPVIIRTAKPAKPPAIASKYAGGLRGGDLDCVCALETGDTEIALRPKAILVGLGFWLVGDRRRRAEEVGRDQDEQEERGCENGSFYWG